MRPTRRLTGMLIGATLGLILGLTACQKERAFVGVWRTEIDSEQCIDIHRVMFFGDKTCSWNDSVFSKTDSVWRQGSIGGTFDMDGSDVLRATFSKSTLSKDSLTIAPFQATFHKESNRRLYCEEIDAYFDYVQRLR